MNNRLTGKQAPSENQRSQKRPAVLPESAELEAAVLLSRLAGNGQSGSLAVRRSSHRFRQKAILQLQQSHGNAFVQRLLESGRLNVQRVPVGRPSLDRPGLVPSATPATAPARGPSALATTPATALSRMPVAVIQDHNRRYATGDHQGALMAVVRHMESQGEIDTNIMAPPTAGGRQRVCANLNRYIVNPSMGSSALATSCGCVQSGGTRLPNVRIEVGPNAIRNAESLHSTLFHEFRHVRQEHEQCNMSSSGSRFGGARTDCNSPEEMDAYLAEVEAGYERSLIRHAWVRVYTNWPWLAPEQQQVFTARQRAARQKVDRLFPNVDWANDSQVAVYEAQCRRFDQAAGGNTYGTCDSPMAPLNAPGPRSGGPIPEPVRRGDFPTPPENERVA